MQTENILKANYLIFCNRKLEFANDEYSIKGDKSQCYRISAGASKLCGNLLYGDLGKKRGCLEKNRSLTSGQTEENNPERFFCLKLTIKIALFKGLF